MEDCSLRNTSEEILHRSKVGRNRAKCTLPNAPFVRGATKRLPKWAKMDEKSNREARLMTKVTFSKTESCF